MSFVQLYSWCICPPFTPFSPKKPNHLRLITPSHQRMSASLTPSFNVQEPNRHVSPGRLKSRSKGGDGLVEPAWNEPQSCQLRPRYRKGVIR